MVHSAAVQCVAPCSRRDPTIGCSAVMMGTSPCPWPNASPVTCRALLGHPYPRAQLSLQLPYILLNTRRTAILGPGGAGPHPPLLMSQRAARDTACISAGHAQLASSYAPLIDRLPDHALRPRPSWITMLLMPHSCIT